MSLAGLKLTGSPRRLSPKGGPGIHCPPVRAEDFSPSEFWGKMLNMGNQPGKAVKLFLRLSRSRLTFPGLGKHAPPGRSAA